MDEMNCTSEEYLSRDGICCDRCPAGKFVQADCANGKKTQCEQCAYGRYTATKNHMDKCLKCKECIASNNQRTERECTPMADTVCKCETGFYCSVADCEHCQAVTHCPKGTGVKVPATHMNDTICAPCEKGTYSDVLDFTSTCHNHTRCGDLGRHQKSLGTPTSDTICGELISSCGWMLPAGLWSGFVLTVLLVLILILWRAKYRSYRAARSSIDLVTAVTPIHPLELPLPATEVNGHCQESCVVETCKLAFFNPDENTTSCTTVDSLDSILPISRLMPLVSFPDSKANGSARNHCSNFLRTPSEPQEDEWNET